MLIFISGGVKGGKSMFAQYLARSLNTEGTTLGYAATMIPYDEEDRKRIRRHISDRQGWGFRTYEEPSDVSSIIPLMGEREVVLLDSLTALVQNNIFPDAETIRSDIRAEDICEGIFELSEKAKDLIVVSDYIFSDAFIYDDVTELFRSVLGRCHCLIAERSDIVLECFFSNIKEWKNLRGTDLGPVKEHYYLNYDHLRYFDI
ncbi:MAG: bifunctional adenosylcobinamide kinase/adenosylcobinamide-phosphate guanylyltransferase [Eubacteriaceae bacterium]|nr:bifunctional adenosylcobinamide kinase/adenosylcobinamide-phosphate guanylyltransferase [Eubacteriaceae bacterium]